MDLLVVRPFGAYRIGDRITDLAVSSTVLATEHATNVVRVAPVTTAPTVVNAKKES